MEKKKKNNQTVGLAYGEKPKIREKREMHRVGPGI